MESPWERVRALKSRCPNTPLQMAVRGRFLVGSRPLPDDLLVRRFILCAAESGIEIFRMHDLLNDVENIAQAAHAVRESGGRLHAGWRSPATCPTCPGWWRRPAAWPRWAPTTCSRTTRPAPSIPAPATRSSPSFGRLPGSRSAYRQGTGGNALAMAIESARDGAEPIATAAYPVAWTLHRVSSEALCDALSGLGLEHGNDQDRLWEASRFIDEHVTSQLGRRS